MSTSRTREKADGELFKSTGIDDNATSTAVTIDASENVFIGQTSLNTANNGHSFGANGNYAHHTSTESTTLILNRKTSDGDILRLRKDNAEVGSINTGTSRIGLRSGDTGIMCAADLDAIYPQNDLAGRDAAIDLGVSGARFKDAYLSGGVYLGGTGAANKLDDYEEGTWTPTGVAFSVATIYSAKYTKIGQQVTVVGYILATANSGNTGGATISGLPFTATGTGYSIGGVDISTQNSVVHTNRQLRVQANGTYLLFQKNNDGVIIGTEVDGGHIIFTATYFTDS